MPKQRKIPDSIRRALAGRGVQVPQIAEMVSHFVALAGGPQAMAKLMYEEMRQAKAGSIIRQRILDSVLKMLAIANNTLPQVQEIDLISDEDLEREIQEMLDKAAQNEQPESEEAGEG